MTIFNPGQAFLGDDTENYLYHKDIEVEAAATILEGQAVTINAAGKAAVIATGGELWDRVGIARESVSAGQYVTVTIEGYVEGARAQGAIAARARVQRSGTTAGSVATSTDTNGTWIALAAAAADRVDLWLT
jgi:hypothetical protein